MTKFDYTTSHRADRSELLKNPPTYLETFKKIEDTKMTKEERAMLSLAVLTGGRISEVLGIQQQDIKVYGKNNIIIESDKYSKCALYEIQKLIVTMMNKKSKKQKFKQVPIINNKLFSKPISWILDRIVDQGVGPNKKVFSFTRTQAWWRIKKRMGNDWFCHMTRHIAASNDVRAGINPGVLKSKLGWANLAPYGSYVHLDVDSIHDELKRIYGPNLEKYNEAVGESTDDRALAKPLSQTQLLGAYAASAEINEVKTKLPMGNIKNAFKRESIILHNGEKQKIYLGREAREIRDKIQASGVLNPPDHIGEGNKKVEVEIVTPSVAAAKPRHTAESRPPVKPVRQLPIPVKNPVQNILQIV